MRSDLADYLSKIGGISLLTKEEESEFFIELHRRGEILWRYLINLLWNNEVLIEEINEVLEKKKRFKEYICNINDLRYINLDLIKRIIKSYKEEDESYKEEKLVNLLKSDKNYNLEELIQFAKKDKKLSEEFLINFIKDGVFSLIKTPINFELFITIKGFLEEKFKDNSLSKEEYNIFKKDFVNNLSHIDRSRNKFTTSNLKLVVAMSKRYMNVSLPWIDIIQEGNLGLFKAIEKFDYKTGNKFSTYAIWWIKQMIIRAIIEKERTIRVPFYMLDQLNKVKKVFLKYLSLENRVPSLKEISKETNIEVEKINQIMEYSDMRVVSINAPLKKQGDGNETFFEEIIEDSRNINTLDRLEDEFIADTIRENMNHLTPIQRDVLNLRYGLLNNSIPFTLEEIGKKYNLSRERIRQIQIKALFKLKKHIKNKKIFQKLR